MNDEQMRPLLKTWFRARSVGPVDVPNGVARVVARLPQTRQRRRWWPLPVFGRPAFLPALNGRQPATGSTMFSALRFIAAAAIVALFGGFLLSGILTTPQRDEMAPAAVTGSPSPVTTEELLSGMVTEEVDPGILRVVHDGVRELSNEDLGFPGYSVDVTPDGSVWVGGGDGEQGLFRLGDASTFDDPTAWQPFKEVGPDGSLWTIGEEGIYRFDGQAWAAWMDWHDVGLWDDVTPGGLAIGPDGTAWGVGSARDERCLVTPQVCPFTVLIRIDTDGSTTTVHDWHDAYAGQVAWDELAVSPDGDVWLIGMVDSDGPEAEALLRYDGEWEVIPGPDWFVNNPLGHSIAFGPGGLLWVNTNHSDDGGGRAGGLARFDGTEWTTFTAADGVEDWGEQGFFATDLLAIAPDGGVWMNGHPGATGGGGVAHYDGTRWTSYLQDLSVHDLDISPDGSVWVRADAYRGIHPAEDVHTFVINPEARG